MKTGGIRGIALATTAIGSMWTAPAFAQDDSAQSASSDDNVIVVTARRFEENLQDVPISITVFNQEQLDSRNITSSTDLAAYTPGLSLNSRFGPEKSSFVIRGFSQELNTLPTVGVYFADVVAPRLSSNITSGNGAGVGDLFDVQNVQVLKGPQGTLFGRNTTGGAILIVPQRPTGRLEGYVEGTYGNYDQRRLQAVLNVPLADTFKVRAGVDWNKRDGYQKNRSSIGPKRFSDSDYIAVRLSILAELTPDLENYTIFKYSRSESNYLIPKLQYCDSATTFFPICSAQLASEADFGYYDVQNVVPDPFVKQRTWQVINTTTWQASDSLTIKNIASYGEAREAYSFNLDGDLTSFVVTNPGPNKPQGNQWTFTEELQFQGQVADSRLTWQAGGYAEISRPRGGQGAQEQYTTIFGTCSDLYSFVCTGTLGQPTVNVLVAKNVYYYRNFGLYAQATYDLNDQFSITGGFRYTWDWQKTDGDNIVGIATPFGPVAFVCSRAARRPGAGAEILNNGECTRTFVEKSSDPTWLINLDYKPTPDILLYAKYARGYRGGGTNEANQIGETWNPETVDSYEIGAKTTWRGSDVHGTFNVTGYWNDFKDQQASVFLPACTGLPTCAGVGINGIQNIGKSRMKGVEVDTSFTFFDALRLDVGYAYLDAKVRAVAPPTNCDPTVYACDQAGFFANPGEVLAFSPKNRVTATATYTLPLDESVGRVSVSATFTHTDSQFHLNASKAAFAAGRVPFDAGIIPATDLLNLNLDWKKVAGSPVDLALFATNVTNEKYWTAAVNGPLSVGGEYVVLGVPRMYGVRVKFNFGE